VRAFLKLLRRQLLRRPGRNLLTVLGTAIALLLAVSIESLSRGLDRALSGPDAARTLMVYRENRYCPLTSYLPERYASRIREIPGVESVLPVRVYLSNCRASLDAVAFEGAPVEELLRSRSLELVEGDLERFRREGKAALVGREFAARRGLAPGDGFRLGDIDVDVAGIFASKEAVEEGLILTHLEYLQRSGPVGRLGTVTQFEVKVGDAARARAVGDEIDALFATAEEPTDTRARVQFLEDATRELREILRFGRLFGLVCVLVVLALVANTVLMSVEERRGEMGVLLTLGYRARHLVGMVLGETLLLTLAGALLGLAGALALIHFSRLAITVEGISVSFSLSPALFAQALSAAAAAAVLAGIAPALRAASTDPSRLLRAV